MLRVPLVLLVFTAIAAGQGDPPPVEPRTPRFVVYAGADRDAAFGIRRAWMNAPKPPGRPPANPDGTVKREHWEVYQEARREHAKATRKHFAAVAEDALAFVNRYPGSEFETEMVRATLSAHAKAENWAGVIAVADAFRIRFGKRFAMECWQKEGDAWDMLHRFDRAATAHALYFAAASSRSDARKQGRAAKKHVQALIRSGQLRKARRAANAYCEWIPRASGFIRAMLSRLEIVGKPLPPTPGIRSVRSKDEIDWRRPRDHPTVVLLWTTQYVEGEGAMRDLATMRAWLGDTPFHVLAVCFEERSSPESIDHWMRANEIRGVELVIQSGRVSQSPILNAWGLSNREMEIALSLPFTIVLDRKGVVRFAACPVGPYLETLIRRVAKRK